MVLPKLPCSPLFSIPFSTNDWRKYQGSVSYCCKIIDTQIRTVGKASPFISHQLKIYLWYSSAPWLCSYTSRTYARRVCANAIPYIKLQQDLINCHCLICQTGDASRTHAGHIQNVCRTCLGRVKNASGTRERCIPDMCKCYLGAQLYCTYN